MTAFCWTMLLHIKGSMWSCNLSQTWGGFDLAGFSYCFTPLKAEGEPSVEYLFFKCIEVRSVQVRWQQQHSSQICLNSFPKNWFLVHYVLLIDLYAAYLIYFLHFGLNAIYLITKLVCWVLHIMQTCPCNEHPITPHFYIVKLGFTGVYIFSYFCSKT